MNVANTNTIANKMYQYKVKSKAISSLNCFGSALC